MAEEKEKTAEEKLLEDAKNSGAAKDGAAGGDEGGDELSPEQKIIAELKEKAKTAEERAAKAERERDVERSQKDSARKEATTAAERQIEAQENSLKSNLSAAKSNFEAAQKEWDDAYDAGDRAKLRAAQERLNDSQMALRGAEFNNEKFKEWKEKGGGTVVSTEKSRFTKVEQDWIDRNPAFNTDRRFRAATYAANEEAVERGIVIDSKEYFDHVNTYLTELGFEVADGVKKAAPAKKEEENEEREETPPKKQEKKIQCLIFGRAGREFHRIGLRKLKQEEFSHDRRAS